MTSAICARSRRKVIFGTIAGRARFTMARSILLGAGRGRSHVGVRFPLIPARKCGITFGFGQTHHPLFLTSPPGGSSKAPISSIARCRRSGRDRPPLRRAGRRRGDLPRHHRIRSISATSSCTSSRPAPQVFIPLTVGGGVRSVADVRRLLNAGADKVSMNTAAVNNPIWLPKRRPRSAISASSSPSTPSRSVRASLGGVYARRAQPYRA